MSFSGAGGIDPGTSRPSSTYAAPPAPPPKPQATTDARYQHTPPPLPPHPQNGPAELPNLSSTYAQPGPPQMLIEPTWLPPILLDKSTADLQHIAAETSLQMALLNEPGTSHPAVEQSQKLLEPLIQQNIELASSLETLAEKLQTQRAATQARLLALRALEQQHRAKIADTEDALRDFSPMALYQRLNASTMEQDQLLRGVEQSWIEEPGQATERELSDWIKRVKETSRVAFLNREKRARWDEGRVGGWK